MDLIEIKKHFDTTAGQIVELVKTQGDEIKAHGTTTAQTAAKLEGAEKVLTQIGDDLKAAQARMDALEANGNRLGMGGFEPVKSVGEQFVESTAFKRMMDARSFTSDPVNVKSLRPAGTKADLTGTVTSATTGTGSLRAQRIDDIVRPARDAFHLRDIMTVRPTTESGLEYVQELGWSNLYTELAVAAAAVDTTITVKRAEGFFVGQRIKVGTLDRVVSAVNYDTNVITLTAAVGAIVAVNTGVSSAVFAGTPETRLKPRSSLSFELRTQNVKTLAHGIPVARQVLNDMSALRAYIDDRLLEGLQDVEDFHILFGDGGARMLPGLLTHANRQTYSWSQGVTGDTRYDAIRRAMTKALVANYPVTGIVLNHVDWESIVLAKGSDGHYLRTTTAGPDGEERLWNVPVVATNVMPAGQAALGAFADAAWLWDREEATVRVAEQHEDFFERNMIFLLGEERVALTNFRPEAFIHVTFNNAPA